MERIQYNDENIKWLSRLIGDSSIQNGFFERNDEMTNNRCVGRLSFAQFRSTSDSSPDGPQKQFNSSCGWAVIIMSSCQAAADECNSRQIRVDWVNFSIYVRSTFLFFFTQRYVCRHHLHWQAGKQDVESYAYSWVAFPATS